MNPGGSLTVVGTGLIAAAHLTPQARGHLEQADRVFYLVAHPAAALLIESLNGAAESLADAYVEGEPRSLAYAAMVERILAPVREGLQVCAAFYGHPGVCGTPTHRAVEQARREGLAASMLPAVSAEDCLFADLGVDPGAAGCQSFDATDFLVRRRRFDPRSVLILWQIGVVGLTTYGGESERCRPGLRLLAEVLLELYPPDHPAVLYHAAQFPVGGPQIRSTPLAGLPEAEVSLASTLYLAPAGPAPADPDVLRRLGMPGAGEPGPPAATPR